MRFRNLLFNGILMLAALSLVIAAVEVALRIAAPTESLWANQHKLCCKHDPLLGWTHIPDHTLTFYSNEYEITESFNSRGIRGPEYPLNKDPGEYRILVLGDSFAEGYTVEFEELFSEILKRRLNQGNAKIEVINLGVGGYSTDQELLQYRQEAKLYEPDLTLLMFHDNDVWYNAMDRYGPWGRGYKPVFRLKDGELILSNVPVPLPESTPTALVKPRGIVTFTTNNIKQTISDYSYLYRWLREKVKNSNRLYSLAIAIGVADKSGINLSGKRPVPAEFDVYRRAYSPEAQAAWKVTEALLKKLKEDADLVGSKLLVFHVPMRATIYIQEWARMQEVYEMDDNAWSIEQVNLELSKVLGRQGIEFLNPLDAMRQGADAMANEGKRLYYKQDGHWNVDGHYYAGELLAEYIRDRFLQGTSHPQTSSPSNF